MSKFIDLAKKIKALADKGVDGEKTTAEKILKGLLKKHNITLDQLEEGVKAEKKKREDFLKTIDGSMTIEHIDTESGEVSNIPVYPPFRTSQSTLQVIIKQTLPIS